MATNDVKLISERESNDIFTNDLVAILDGGKTASNVGVIFDSDDLDTYKLVVSKASGFTFAGDSTLGSTNFQFRIYLDEAKTILLKTFSASVSSVVSFYPGVYFVEVAPNLGATFPAAYGFGVEVELYDKLVNSVFAPEDDPTLEGGVLSDVLNGTSGNDFISGRAGNDKLIGGAGNDVLWGGTGADTFNGGTGNDFYLIDNIKDVIQTDVSGIDTVATTIGITKALRADLEDIKLLNKAVIAIGNAKNNLIVGNEVANNLGGGLGDDTLIGGAMKDTLSGGAGNDTLDGGSDNDSMVGGAGNDTYIVDNQKDIVIEAANGGIDTVIATTDITKLAANVENLILANSTQYSDQIPDPDTSLTGSTDTIDGGSSEPTDSAVIYGVGNALNNHIDGNSGYNYLMGMAGNDTINGGGGDDAISGGAGQDVLYGGDGADVFIFDVTASVANFDIIMDFDAGKDKIMLSSAVFTKLDAGDLVSVDGNLIVDGLNGDIFYNNGSTTVQVAHVNFNGAGSLSESDFIVM